jgi:predicted enzyme related to lactoylglutathione lyase
MLTTIHHIAVDCRDAYAQAQFWSQVFGTPINSEDNPGDPESLVDTGPGQPGMLFITVPEGKHVKNRVHLDFTPTSARDDEVIRLLALGATHVDDQRRPDGAGWVVLADPEGNEFCIERSPAERGV